MASSPALPVLRLPNATDKRVLRAVEQQSPHVGRPLLDSWLEGQLLDGRRLAVLERTVREQAVVHAYQQYGGHQCHAASALGIHRNTFYRILVGWLARQEKRRQRGQR